VNFELKLSAASVAKLSSNLNITGELLRYLLVSVDDKTKAKIADVNKRRDESNDNERERNNGKKY
jgi:ribosomal protein S6